MTQFQDLVSLYNEHFETLVDQNGEVLATQRDRDLGIAIPLSGSRGVREKLRLRYMAQHESKTPREEALTQVVRWIEGNARDKAQVSQEVSIRTGQLQGSRTVWVDLGTTPPAFVRIDPHGWTIEETPEAGVVFRRPTHTESLPLPVEDSDPDFILEKQLANFLNVDPADIELLVGTIASGFVYRIPHPIIAFDGPHGSAKTFASRILADLLDPTAGHQRVPNGPQDLLAGVRNSWVYALDNLTYIKGWLANDLCGLVTGYRSDTRKLYTNDDVHSVSLQRVVILSSTHFSGIARSDLVERTIFFPTPFIGEENRRSEEDLLNRFIPLVPRILGRIFSLVSAGLKGLDRPEVLALELPRMADFGRFLAALDAEVGGRRFERYQDKLRTSVSDALRADSVGAILLQFMDDQDSQPRMAYGKWTGTATVLHIELSRLRSLAGTHSGKSSDWPGSPSMLMAQLNGIEPSLRANGIRIERHRTGDKRQLTITWVSSYQDVETRQPSTNPVTTNDPFFSPR